MGFLGHLEGTVTVGHVGSRGDLSRIEGRMSLESATTVDSND